MIFKNDEHKSTYEELVKKTKSKEDCYRKALFYLLALNEDTRRNIELLYDFKENGIKTSGLEEAFQTSTSIRTTRLAFNLFNNFCEEDKPYRYTPEDIFYVFGKEEIAYAIEALKIRFEWK